MCGPRTVAPAMYWNVPFGEEGGVNERVAHAVMRCERPHPVTLALLF
jgi:hypothetical protein